MPLATVQLRMLFFTQCEILRFSSTELTHGKSPTIAVSTALSTNRHILIRFEY